MNTTPPDHQIGDRVLVLHNIPLGNLIGTVTAIHYATYEVTLDGGGKSNMFGFQLQPLPAADCEECEGAGKRSFYECDELVDCVDCNGTGKQPLASERKRIAAGTADEKPDGQAENK